jgi:hypothetical protein
LLLAVALAGCGDTLSLDPVAKAADASAKQTSEHISMTMMMTTAGTAITMTGDGDFRNNPNLGSFAVSISGPQAATMREVMKDTTVYMTSDLFQGQLPDGKTWLAIDVAKTTKALGLDPSSLTSSQSPTQALATLRASGGKVTTVGNETIDGVETTHYSAVLDAERVAKVNAALTKAYGSSATYQPVDVWVDGQDLVRKMHLAYSIAGGTAAGMTADMTMTFSNYGEPVAVDVPPSSAVFDATKLATP